MAVDQTQETLQKHEELLWKRDVNNFCAAI